MASELRVNTSTNRVGLGTITYTDTGPIISGITTGNNFKTGTTNVHSTGVELANINTGGLTATFGGYISLPQKIIHTGDADTSIEFDTNIIKFETAGSERLRITSDGKVGIGSAIPGAPLDVEGGTKSTQYQLKKAGDSTSIGAYLQLTNQAGDSNSNDVTLTAAHSTNSIVLRAAVKVTAWTYYNSAYRERLRIAQDGAVMINTTNSSSRTLNLNGTFGILSTNQSGVIDMSVTDAGVASIGPYVAGGSTLLLKTNPSGSGVAERVRIDSSGRLGLKTSAISSYNGSADDVVIDNGAADVGVTLDSETQCSFAFTDSAKTGWDGWIKYVHSDNHLEFGAGAGERLRITSAGNVVIGHTATNNTFQIGNTGHSGYGLAMQAATYGAILQVGEGTTPTTAAALWTRNMNNGGTPTTLFRVNGNGVCIAGDSSTYDGGNTKPNLYVRGTGGRQMKIHNPNAGTCSLQMTNSTTGQGEDAGTQLFTQGGTGDFWIQSAYATADIAFATKPSGGSTTERFRIGSDGKLYKDGNHFYPLVNYVEVSSFTGASVSSNSYTDLRTIYSGYTPKKAGNLIVIHHQSQCWQGGQANSNGDAFWKIQRSEGGGSWTDTIENGRIMGNMDGRNYTGNSGLARHHRTVHLMGSFTCTGSSFNLKTQGKVDFTSVGLQWYHHSNNILQIWEYEKG